MLRILLAEDDESMRVYLTRALERVGYLVTSVDRGTAAVPLLESEPFDLLLTDIVMPEMDGIELAQKAADDRARHPGHVHHRLRRGRAQGRPQDAATPRCSPSPSTSRIWSPRSSACSSRRTSTADCRPARVAPHGSPY